MLKSYFCKNRTGSFNLHSRSSAFAQFKWEMDRKWRDKPCEELPWLQWKATYQALKVNSMDFASFEAKYEGQ